MTGIIFFVILVLFFLYSCSLTTVNNKEIPVGSSLLERCDDLPDYHYDNDDIDDLEIIKQLSNRIIDY